MALASRANDWSGNLIPVNIAECAFMAASKDSYGKKQASEIKRR